MVSVCLPSDAFLQHLPSYLGFFYLGRRVSLHSCSSKAQPLLLTLDEGYLLTTAPPDLERGVAPLGPSALTATAPWTCPALTKSCPVGPPSGQVMVERSDRMWSTGKGNGKPLQYSCLENSMENSGRLQSMGSEVRGSGQEELPHA